MSRLKRMQKAALLSVLQVQYSGRPRLASPGSSRALCVFLTLRRRGHLAWVVDPETYQSAFFLTESGFKLVASWSYRTWFRNRYKLGQVTESLQSHTQDVPGGGKSR